MRRLALVISLALALLVTAATAAAADDAPSDVLALYLQSVAQRDAGDVEGAAASLEQARVLAPDDPDLALELARSYAAARWYGAAAAAYAEAAQLAPTRADVALAQARFHLDGGFRVRVGLEAAERAARLTPDDPTAIALLDRARAIAALFEA
jgi:tetratricopeptide (TPR) repeat protein